MSAAARPAAPRARAARRASWLRLSPYARTVVVITALGSAWRLAFLGLQPLWRDEAFTGLVERRSLQGMLDAVGGDSAPPLFYLLARPAAVAFDSPWALRLVPALAGAALIPLVAALARRAAGARAGVAAAALAAVMPAAVVASRDARMYALAATLVCAQALALWRYVERPTGRRLLAYGVLVCLAVYTQYFAALGVVAALAGAMLALRAPRPVLLRAATAAGAAAATLVPWLLAARAQFQHTGPFWVRLDLPTVAGVPGEFFAGEQLSRGARALLAQNLAVTAAQGVAVLAGVVAAVWCLRATSRAAPAGRRAIAYIAVCGLGAILLLALASLREPVLNARYAGVVWAPLVALLGVGVAAVGSRRLAVGVVAVMAGAGALSTLDLPNPDMPPAVAYLQQRVGPQDLVVTRSPDFLLILYYGRGEVADRARMLAPGGAPWHYGTAAYPPGAQVDSVPAVAGTIYAVTGRLDPAEQAPDPPAGFRRRGEAVCFGNDVCVTAYAR